MSIWEPSVGASDEWFTPRYVFDALGCEFDLDVAAPRFGPRHVPCKWWLSEDALSVIWNGFVWCNPPFGGRNGLVPWIRKFVAHGNGILLTPDRTSAPWWHEAAMGSSAFLLVAGKIKFERPDGSIGASPGTGTTLFASGDRGVAALRAAQQKGLGCVCG
jgi:hypothetical protein